MSEMIYSSTIFVMSEKVDDTRNPLVILGLTRHWGEKFFAPTAPRDSTGTKRKATAARNIQNPRFSCPGV